MIKSTIEPRETIVLINQAWAQFFARTRTNKKSVDDCGWYLLNHNWLLNMTLRVTMADGDNGKEAERALVSTLILPALTSTTFTAPTISASTTLIAPVISTSYVARAVTNTPQFDSLYIVRPTPDHEKMNYLQGAAALCLDSIVAHTDLMNARE